MITLNQKNYKGGDTKSFQLKAGSPYDEPLYIKVELIKASCNEKTLSLKDAATLIIEVDKESKEVVFSEEVKTVADIFENKNE